MVVLSGTFGLESMRGLFQVKDSIAQFANLCLGWTFLYYERGAIKNFKRTRKDLIWVCLLGLCTLSASYKPDHCWGGDSRRSNRWDWKLCICIYVLISVYLYLCIHIGVFVFVYLYSCIWICVFAQGGSRCGIKNRRFHSQQ